MGFATPSPASRPPRNSPAWNCPPDHPLHENINDIIGEADKLDARIKTLLDFAKPFEPHPAPCRVEQIVADAVTFLRNQVVARGIDLVVDVPPTLPEVELDYAQIEQVLLALLSNAIEATPAGGRVTISGRLADDGQHLCLDVGDTGSGIAPDQMPRLFTLFFTTKSSGTGLGLPVAKKIVERHGGTITVESEVGAGARFAIVLPLSRPDPLV